MFSMCDCDETRNRRRRPIQGAAIHSKLTSFANLMSQTCERTTDDGRMIIAYFISSSLALRPQSHLCTREGCGSRGWWRTAPGENDPDFAPCAARLVFANQHGSMLATFSSTVDLLRRPEASPAPRWGLLASLQGRREHPGRIREPLRHTLRFD